MHHNHYEDSFRSFSPQMQDFIQNCVEQALESVNQMNKEIDNFEDYYGLDTVHEMTIDTMLAEFDPNGELESSEIITGTMESAIKFCVLNNVQYVMNREDDYELHTPSYDTDWNEEKEDSFHSPYFTPTWSSNWTTGTGSMNSSGISSYSTHGLYGAGGSVGAGGTVGAAGSQTIRFDGEGANGPGVSEK